jgi:hypothetical protein
MKLCKTQLPLHFRMPRLPWDRLGPRASRALVPLSRIFVRGTRAVPGLAATSTVEQPLAGTG